MLPDRAGGLRKRHTGTQKGILEKDIEIHLGLEVEYYPASPDKLLALTAQYPIEYYLLGQHEPWK